MVNWLVSPLATSLEFIVLIHIYIALCQRDPNHFDFLSEPATFEKMRQTAMRFWNEKVKDVWMASRNCTHNSFNHDAYAYPEFSV